jgi:hypothetical protein
MVGPMRAATVVFCALLLPFAASAITLDRDRDPVVMTGLDLPTFSGAQVDRIAAFRYEAGWIQIPVQIDERDTVDFRDVYNNILPWPVPIWTLAYSDPTTYTGPDSDPLFDDDDELVFMAADAGDRTPHAQDRQAGLIPGSGLEVAIGDPLDGGTGYVYLFETDGTLDPGAGASYGTYSFNLLAGSYPDDYNLANGPNPEDSEFFSPLYRTHFSDRWIRDELEVTTAGSTGIDILDRHKNMFGPGVCQRTEDTFSNGEGAFFANISGPVRSIRSYMGANSGPLTQRDHLFYEGRQDITTFLRVHAIPGVMDLYDYSPGAIGMIYHNDLNPLGASRTPRTARTTRHPASPSAPATTSSTPPAASGSMSAFPTRTRARGRTTSSSRPAWSTTRRPARRWRRRSSASTRRPRPSRSSRLRFPNRPAATASTTTATG